MRNGMRPVHPGEVLREDYLAELGMSAAALARALHVPTNRITGVLNGERAVTADTALRLARYFGTSPEFWMNMQATYELRTAEIASGKKITAEIKPHELASKPVPRTELSPNKRALAGVVTHLKAEAEIERYVASGIVNKAAKIIGEIARTANATAHSHSARAEQVVLLKELRRAKAALNRLQGGSGADA